MEDSNPNFKAGLWSGLGFAVLLGLPVQALAVPTNPCQLENVNAHYLATFELKTDTQKVRSMVFCVSKPSQDSEKKPITAEIWSNHGREAICKHTYFERDGLTPVSMILECKSSRFAPLNTPVTLFWPSGEIAEPVLRFGTWLNGYVQSPLRVKYDHFTQVVRVASRSRSSQ